MQTGNTWLQVKKEIKVTNLLQELHQQEIQSGNSCCRAHSVLPRTLIRNPVREVPTGYLRVVEGEFPTLKHNEQRIPSSGHVQGVHFRITRSKHRSKVRQSDRLSLCEQAILQTKKFYAWEIFGRFRNLPLIFMIPLFVQMFITLHLPSVYD